MIRQLAQVRSALRLSIQDFPDLSPDAQAGTLPIESITIVLLSQLVQGLVTVSHQLSGVTQAVATISEENENLREELHDFPSQLANLPPKRWPHPYKGRPNPAQLRAPHLRRRAKKRPVHHPHLPQPRLTTLNTSYHSTIRGLARRSVTPRSTPT